MPTPQDIAMQNQANQNRRQQEEQQEQQRRQGRNAGELGGNWNKTFGTPQVGGIQNPNPSWNKPASTPVAGSGSPVGATGVIGGSQSGYNPPPTGPTIAYDAGGFPNTPTGVFSPTGNVGTGMEVIGGPPVGVMGVLDGTIPGNGSADMSVLDGTITGKGSTVSGYNPLPTPSTLTGI